MSKRAQLAAIIGLGFLLKLPAFFHPLLGYFSSYQTMNAMFAEMMQQGHWLDIRSFMILHGGPSLHLLYFPFASFFAVLLQWGTNAGMDFCGRFQAGICTAIAAVLFYGAIQKHLESVKNTPRIALLSTLFLTFSPMMLLSGISFQNEAPAILFFLISVYLLSGSSAGPCRCFIAGIFFSLALTARLHFLFAAPIFLYLLVTSGFKFLNLFLFALGALSPVCSWFAYTHFLEAAHPEQTLTSLFSQAGEKRLLKESLLTNPLFYGRMAKTLIGQMLTPVAALFAFWGFLKAPREYHGFRVWLLFALSTLLLLPQKSLDHSFYLILAVPPAALFAGYAFDRFWTRWGIKPALLLFGLFFLLCLRYYTPPAFSNDGADFIPAIGKEVQKLVPENAVIIAERGTTPDLLYYSKRFGWGFDLQMARHPLEDQPRYKEMREKGYGDPIKWLEKLKGDGAQFFIVSSKALFDSDPDFSQYVRTHYREIRQQKDFYMFDLGVFEA